MEMRGGGDQKLKTNLNNLNSLRFIHSGSEGIGNILYTKLLNFYRLAYLKNVHEQRHTRSGAHKCQQCNRSFPQASEYR